MATAKQSTRRYFATAIGYCDLEGQWHPFPPPPQWDPRPIALHEKIKVFMGGRWITVKAVFDPCPLFRDLQNDGEGNTDA